MTGVKRLDSDIILNYRQHRTLCYAVGLGLSSQTTVLNSLGVT